MKTQPAAQLAMFEAEAAGLRALAASRTVRVPEVLAVGRAASEAWLVLEWLELGRADARAETLLGERLAALHGCTGERFGWTHDNTIGSTPQINTPDGDWVTFFRERRLRFQLELARSNGCDGDLYDSGLRLCERVADLLEGHVPAPSLVHGDLWGGNWATTRDGEPVIFDPAVHYADREVDIALTQLFGGFGPRFHDAYGAAWPLDAGAPVRCELYQLYHVLNHFNLFGGGYAASAARMIASLLAEAR